MQLANKAAQTYLPYAIEASVAIDRLVTCLGNKHMNDFYLPNWLVSKSSDFHQGNTTSEMEHLVSGEQ